MKPVHGISHPLTTPANALTTAKAPAGAKAPSKTGSTKEVDPALKHVAEEFEGALLRQLLKSAKVGGKDSENGYGGMAVDALASGLQAGGGLGLAHAIEQALGREHELMTSKPKKG